MGTKRVLSAFESDKCFDFFAVLRNQKGIALISVYIAAVTITTLAGAAFGKSFLEMRHVEREISRMRSYAAAEAGLQRALVQIGQNAYTGFINTNDINVDEFRNVDGLEIGSFAVQIAYPGEADWVIVNSTGEADGDVRAVEGRVFLESNFSKYLVYADTPDFGSGDNAQYGYPDLTDANGDGVPDYPEQVSPNEDDRAALYFTGDWTMSGSSVKLYGDAHAEGIIDGNSSSAVHGDTYVSSFATDAWGSVVNSGVTGSPDVGDGFNDDTDRNRDGTVDANDYPDYHDLTDSGSGDARAIEDLVEIDSGFYSAHNNTSVFAQSSPGSYYLQFQVSADGNSTTVVKHRDGRFNRADAVYELPRSAIVFVNGDAYVKGEIQGRVTVVASDDICFMGDTTYAAGQKTADVDHSTAFFAQDRLFFVAEDLEVSGILYAENGSGSSVAFDATYRYDSNRNRFVSDPYSKEILRLYGNRVINGRTNLSYYPDRIYGYDKNLRYFRPPGIPVIPDLRLVREVEPEEEEEGGEG